MEKTQENLSQHVIQELQIIEHNLQNLLMQKQAFQMEINETANAIEEVKKSNDNVYKITSSIMIKTDKEKVLPELEEKNKMLEMRFQALDKQEALFQSKAKELQNEVQKNLEKEKGSKQK